jgi:hypothetical protein
MAIFEERGLFWWHEECIPDGKFAPDAAVPGLLSIADEGFADLNLDGRLPTDQGTFAMLFHNHLELRGKCIEGILTLSNRHILLSDLIRRGGRFNSSNLSQDGFRATHCLVSNLKFPFIDENDSFERLTIDLSGYEAWLRLSSINFTRKDTTISIEYQKNDPVIFETDEGRVVIRYEIFGPIKGSREDEIFL